MSTIIASSREAVPQNHYHPRTPDVIQRLFRERFAAFEAAWEERYADACGKYRLPLLQRAAEAFRVCGDWQEGIARVHCPDCGHDLFVPFSCKSFFLCPSCGQKRTLLLGEYLSQDLLLSLPHRQFVLDNHTAFHAVWLRSFTLGSVKLHTRIAACVPQT